MIFINFPSHLIKEMGSGSSKRSTPRKNEVASPTGAKTPEPVVQKEPTPEPPAEPEPVEVTETVEEPVVPKSEASDATEGPDSAAQAGEEVGEFRIEALSILKN